MSQKTNEPQSAFNLYSASVELIKKNTNTFIALALVPALLTALINIRNNDNGSVSVGFMNFNTTPGRIDAALGIGLFLVLILIAVYVFVSVMAQILYLKGAQNNQPSFSELTKETKKYLFRYIGLSIVTALAIIGGLILFIVPGIIAIRRYILAPYVLIDKDMDILDSMSESARLTKPYSMSVYAIIGVSILISIVATILGSTLGAVGALLGTFVTLGYAFAPAIRYVELKKLDK